MSLATMILISWCSVHKEHFISLQLIKLKAIKAFTILDTNELRWETTHFLLDWEKNELECIL